MLATLLKSGQKWPQLNNTGRSYTTHYQQLSPVSATVTVSAETQLLSQMFWGSCQLILYTNVYSPDTPPLPLSATAGLPSARAQKALHVTPIKSAKEQSPFKILQCSNTHWLSLKTLRANPTVFNSTLTKNRLVSTLIAEYPTTNSSDILQVTLSASVKNRI